MAIAASRAKSKFFDAVDKPGAARLDRTWEGRPSYDGGIGGISPCKPTSSGTTTLTSMSMWDESILKHLVHELLGLTSDISGRFEES